MTYRKEVIAEIVRRNSEHFGRGPTLFDYIKFRFIIRKWSYEKLLQGLVTMNNNIAFLTRIHK